VDSPVTIGGGSRSFTPTTIAESDKILGVSACQSGSPAIFSCSGNLSAGLNENTLENLLAQTLGLGYNIGNVSGYTGQAVSAFGCSNLVTPALSGLGLSAASSVNQVFTAANALIANSVSGGSTTQTQAGDMNALLGDCLNKE
jgi:hypothetical protein